MKQFVKQKGLTLIELMISLGIGLFVLLVAATVYTSTVVNSLDTVASSRLNQELNILMSVMVQDIRRAGYSGDSDVIATPLVNAFNVVGNTAPRVIQNMANPTTEATAGSCILYSYDADEDGLVDDRELFGFRLNAGVVQLRQERDAANVGDVDCDGTDDDWLDVTDGNFINVTSLIFDSSGSECLNAREPDGIDNGGTGGTVDDADEADCYLTAPTVGSGDITTETREILVTLAGNLQNDTDVRLQISQTIRIRNDLLRER